ncbi:hypothetical protein TWF970_010963 [Orbilia oligospora]|uniref:Uncharacterized protein n=1 Tax=Orbilia oligospora TaxID=2813651 RepID=A0A7C8RCQ4_ORBOL|nr:hypothetical protein TWF970_010963 [Orbilia oligospora]
MYINQLKRQLGAPGNILPPSGDPAGASAPPPVQAWAPPPVVQPAPPGSQAPPVWSPPGQVVPGRPAKPPASGDTTAANQLPNGVDPAAYNSMFGEPTQPLDLVSDKVPSTRTSTHYSRTTKGDMAAGILVLIFLAGPWQHGRSSTTDVGKCEETMQRAIRTGTGVKNPIRYIRYEIRGLIFGNPRVLLAQEHLLRL